MDRGDYSGGYNSLRPFNFHQHIPVPSRYFENQQPNYFPSNHDGERRRGKKRYSSQKSETRTLANSSSSASSFSIKEQQGRNYLCRGCDLHYDYYIKRNTMTGRIPCILPCGHSLCQDCINKAMRTKKKVDCFVCHDNEFSKNKQADFNFYILGHILSKKLTGNDIPDLKLSSTKIKCIPKVIDTDSQFKCGSNSCHKTGTVACLNCFKFYCDECDDKMHKEIINNEIHMRNRKEKISFELSQCSDHNAVQDIRCTRCETSCCCYCFLEKHAGHSHSYLKRLDESQEEDLQESYKVVGETLKQLQQNSNANVEKDKVTNIEDEIAEQFADIHAKLYLIEKKLLEEVKQKRMYEDFCEGDAIIATNIDAMTHIIDCVAKRCSVNYNMKELCSKLRELKEMSPPQKFSYDRNLKLIIDEKFHKLEDCFKLNASSLNISIPTSGNEEDEDSSDTGSVKLANIQQWLVKQQNFEAMRDTEYLSNNGEKMDETSFTRQTVFVIHVTTADCFYVHAKERRNNFRKLEKLIDEDEKMPLGMLRIKINAIYLAPTKFSSIKWGRAQVMHKLKGDDENPTYLVNFIDFGHVDAFTRKELKRISSKFLINEKPFAIKCKLHVPTGTAWGDKANLKLADILSVNKEVIMSTQRIFADTHLVDLWVSDSVGNFFPVVDLITQKQSTNEQMPIAAPESVYFGPTRIFENTDTFLVGQSYDILIRYVLDPWHIFIQKASYDKTLLDMINSMEQFYKHSECDVCLPVRGSDVVVFYPSTDFGDWHRGRIQDFSSSNKNADVFLVDWGKQVNVRWADMRKLVGLFQGTECLVFCAQLADIYPKSDGGWLSEEGIEATNFLEKYCIKSKVFKMLVSESDPLQIALFDRKGEFDENINALLVENDLAISKGKLSNTVKWPLKEEVPDKLDTSEFFPIQKTFSDSDTEEEVDGIKLRVKLVRFVNPHLIYLSIISKKPQTDRLYEELQIHYKHSHHNLMKRLWHVNDNVVVFDDAERDYYRGTIEAIEKNKFTVYLRDTGGYLTVEEKDLRPILPYFENNFPNSVMRCHLANLKPAGGSEKWSTTSIEWFQRVFDKHKDLFIQKIENDDLKSSLPITMWYSKVVQGGALEPTTYRYFSIEIKAVNAGLAFQKTKTSRLKKKPIALEPSEEIIPETFTNISQFDEETKETKSVSLSDQWLPSEPLTKVEFNAYVTCVEGQGYLYIRDLKLMEVYKEMESYMKEHFDTLEPAKPFVLRKNQMVTIFSEKVWYRGLVLEIIDTRTARVMMVDFGSDHIVDICHLHNRIMYSDIPILASKISLHDIRPKHNRKWTDYNTDTLLTIIPEFSKIVIRSKLSDKIPAADIYDNNGMCVNDELVKLCNNLCRLNGPSAIYPADDNLNYLQNNKKLSNSSDTLSSEGSLYSSTNYAFVRPPILPDQKVPCEIISAFSYNIVSLFYTCDRSKEIEFELLSESIQTEAQSLEPMTDVAVGMPCVSRFNKNLIWYRAQIFQVPQDNKTVNVFYVDYGNFEAVDLCDIRPIKPEWLVFPAYCSIAEIDYKLINKGAEEEIYDLVQSILSSKVCVEVVRRSPFSVHLYDEDGHLLYQKFVENGTVVLK